MNAFSPVAAAAFLGDPVHDAILAGAASDGTKFAAYLEAVSKCPQVIREESPHAMFLSFCNHNVSLAASRLASFWSVRKEVFGPIGAFMPTVHALTEEEKAKIAQGPGVFLPPKKTCDRLVFFWDRSRITTKWTGKSIFKAFWFAMHSFSLELYHQSSETFEGIHVTLLQPQARATTCVNQHPLATPTSSTEDLRTRIIRDALCLRFKEMHAVAIIEEKASKRVLLQTVVPVTMETIREVLGVQQPVKLHLEATVPQVLLNLEAEGFSAKHLPASVGGSWSYEAEWRQRLQEKGILPTPILLKKPPSTSSSTAAAAAAASVATHLRRIAPPSQGVRVVTHGSDISALPLAPSDSSYARLANDGIMQRAAGSSAFAFESALKRPPPSGRNPFTIAPKPIPKRPPPQGAVNPFTSVPRPIPTGPPAPAPAAGIGPFASTPRPIPTRPPPTAGISPFASAPRPIPKLPPHLGVNPFTTAPKPIPKGPPPTLGRDPFASAPRPIPKGPHPFTAQPQGPLAGLARIMRQSPPGPAIVTPGSTPEPLSLLGQLGPPPPPVRRGKPLGLAELGLLRSLPASRKVAVPEPRHPLHEAIASLPVSTTAAYKEAMNRCPQIVKTDSPYEQFLVFCQGDPGSAARRLAMYWNLRRQIFGETDAFLPLSQALAMFDVTLLVRGDLGAIIAAGGTCQRQKRRPILYLHGGGDVQQASKAPNGSNPKLRVLWYLLQSVADLAGRNPNGEGFSGAAEAICICRLIPLTLAVFTDDIAESVSSMIRDAMCVRFELHVAVPGVGTSPAATQASPHLAAFAQVVPMALEFLGEMVSCKSYGSSGPNSITVHQSAEIDQVRTSLEALTKVPGEFIPSSCGGSWDLEADWRSWLQNHSTLRGPLALVLMMIKPTEPPPGKRKFVLEEVHRVQHTDGCRRH